MELLVFEFAKGFVIIVLLSFCVGTLIVKMRQHDKNR